MPNGGGGFLVLREPWPSMLRTIWGDDQRFIDTYWSRFGAGAGQGDEWIYFAGDGAKKDDDGALWLLGRVDDVMLISGHNISTTEVESALVSHPSVAEAAVVGATDPTTGQAIVAFTIPRGNVDTAGDAGEKLIVRSCATTWPRRSARSPSRGRSCWWPSCRRPGPARSCGGCCKDVAENRSLGDVTTLQDSAVMDLISVGNEDGKIRRLIYYGQLGGSGRRSPALLSCVLCGICHA